MPGAFGEYFASLRRQKTALGLREFCELNGFDPGNLSKMERGKLNPPKSQEKLTEYAHALGLVEGSGEWYEFFDRAAADRGEIPSDILEDEELADQLPVLFRTLRGEQVTEDQKKTLMDIIRRA